jgi:predicted metal-dependent phosphoesterase TrpH
MNPKDIKTLADVRRWLAHHVEWTDIASEDMAAQAALVIDAHVVRQDLADRRLARAVERLRGNAEVGCYGTIRKAMCQPHDKCSACRSRATLEQIAMLR